MNAANQEWAGKMQTDIHDAVGWAVGRGLVDGTRVAIMGGSYGGYAALVGMTQTPKAFACGVSRAGIPNLVPYFTKTSAQAFMDLVAARVFDPRTEAGRAALLERSPIQHVGDLKRPLLIVHGEQDPRIRTEDVSDFVSRARSKGAKVSFAAFPDEGHSLRHANNQLAFYAIVEEFLAECLGGRREGPGSDVSGSSLRFIH